VIEIVKDIPFKNELQFNIVRRLQVLETFRGFDHQGLHELTKGCCGPRSKGKVIIHMASRSTLQARPFLHAELQNWRFLESGSQRPLTGEIGFCADSGFAGFNRRDRRWIKVWRGVGSGKSIY
jgi:hypothetical protein